jgi:hypothetical protein
MKSSSISHITNDNVGFAIKRPADERTPLLSSNNTTVAAVDVVSSKAVVATEVASDEEAPRWVSVTDKQAQPETPRNIAGVISILLMGTYFFFGRLELQQKRSFN